MNDSLIPPAPLDSPDDIDHRRVREQLRASLFGRAQQPVRVDRYTVGKRLGRGASGAVFSAHDARLHREVALKLVRLDGRTPDAKLAERIDREAQALARLSHHHVVHVYDVGQHGDSLFIAMELVDGESLEQWQRQRHPWLEVLDVYRRAGEGLAEAHRRGVVHKDFKPGNVMVGHGDPRRVCVADFGLASLMKDELAVTQDDDGRLEPDARAPTWTVGFTPAYAAPEQMTGRVVDERGDQYAFCVALFEALFGELPFAGTDLRTLVRNKQEGHIVPFGRRDVPPRIVRALQRGLHAEPEQRHASMTALLGELRPPRSRVVPGVAVAMVLGMGGIAAAMIDGDDRVPVPIPSSEPCGGYDDLAERQWDPVDRERVHAAFLRTGLPYAETASVTVSGDLDALRTQWVKDATHACVARRVVEGDAPKGRTPESERSRCLDARLLEIGAFVERLAQADQALVEHAHELVHQLPRLEDCRLGEPPGATVSDAQLEELDGKLAAANIALAIDDWQAATNAAGDAHKLALELELELEAVEASIGLGRAQLELGQVEVGVEMLETAARRAEQLDEYRLAWLGWINLAQRGFEDDSQRDKVREWLAKADSATNRLGHDDYYRMQLQFERTNLGLVEGQAAIEQLEEVWRWLEGQGRRGEDLRIATGMTLATLLLGSPDAKRAADYAHEALSLADERLGSGHPRTLMARLDYGMGLMDRCGLEEAESQLRSADEGARGLGRAHARDRVRILVALAQIHFQTGHPEEAKLLLQRAEELDSDKDSDSWSELEIGRGVVAFAEGRLDDAATHFSAAAQWLEERGERERAALARAMLGESRLYTGGVAEAAALADAARHVLAADYDAYLAIPLKVAGLAALHQRQPDKAVTLLERARALTSACDRPELADIDYGLSVAFEAQGHGEAGSTRRKAARAAFESLGAPGMARLGRLEQLLAGAQKAG